MDGKVPKALHHFPHVGEKVHVISITEDPLHKIGILSEDYFSNMVSKGLVRNLQIAL